MQNHIILRQFDGIGFGRVYWGLCMSVRRRTVLKGLPVLGATALVSSPAISQSRRTLRAATVFPVAAEGPGAAARRYAKAVQEASGGGMTVEIVDAGADGRTVYSAVSDGDIDMCFAADEMWRSLNPAFSLFSSPPGGMTANEFESWIKWGGGQDVWNALSEDAGVTPFLVGDSGPSHTLLAAPELRVADLSRMMVQSTGLTSDLWSLLGAGEVRDSYSGDEIARADIYNGDDALGALRTHFGHYTARLSTPMNRINNAISLTMNRNMLTGLPEADRLILELAANREHMAQRTDAMLMSHRTTDIILGLTPVETPPEFAAAQSIAFNTLLSQISDFDALAADAVWSFQLHQEDVAGWSAIGEGAYLGARSTAGAIR